MTTHHLAKATTDSPTYRLAAPCKLNLFLHITGRRVDGYHNLQTLFQMLDVGDELHFTPRTDGVVTLKCNDPSLETADNLVLRAAHLLKERAMPSAGVDIFLDKQTPMGGGLGGGSSDAATTLHALNRLWSLHLTTDELAALGLQLGADVPVFVHGVTAFAEGVGEHLQAVEIPETWYLVVTPNVHVSTAAVFTHPELIRDTKPMTLASLLDSNWHNDCQPLVERLYPEVAITLQWLVKYAPSRMTGTGASVFASFQDESSARRALADLPPQYRGFVARGVNQSPLWIGLEQLPA
jgi:4-diphosphocytidyl-2-C-methyl-D-erythritol kinase